MFSSILCLIILARLSPSPHSHMSSTTPLTKESWLENSLISDNQGKKKIVLLLSLKVYFLLLEKKLICFGCVKNIFLCMFVSCSIIYMYNYYCKSWL